MSRQRRHLRSPTAAVWIALLSILMTVIAPAISQSLMAQEREAARHAHADHAVHAHAELASAHQPSHSQDEHGGHQSHEACGYCSFFAHSPVIGKTDQPVVMPAGPSAQPAASRRLAFLPKTLAYRPQQPRAPPLPLAVLFSPSDPSARLGV